jgi:di/tricarboxylate transporter
VIGLGNLISHSSIGSSFADWLIPTLALQPGDNLGNYLSITLASTLISVFTVLPGAPAVITPLTAELAQATGLSETSILMMQIVGFANFPFAYQAPSIVVGLSIAGIRIGQAFKPMLTIFFISYILLVPLNYLWWLYLGWI